MNTLNLISTENQSHADWTANAILAWVKAKGVIISEVKMREYKDEPGHMVYNRPVTIVDDLFLDEMDGCQLTFNLEPTIGTTLSGDKVQTLLLELMGRLRNYAWPKELYQLNNTHDLGIPEVPFDKDFTDPMISESCWHHTSISYNRYFSTNECYYCKLEYGYCYCS